MRKPLAFLAIAFVVIAAAVSVTGQEEPLPPVFPRAALSEEPLVLSLPSEPLLLPAFGAPEYTTASLVEAAERNDFAAFDAAYRALKERGAAISSWDALHQLWTWSINDRVGAFYGSEIHDRLRTSYAGYADYIAPHAIRDQRGNSWYPTSETRRFLIARAREGVQGAAPITASSEPARAAETIPLPAISPAAEDASRPLEPVIKVQTPPAAPSTAVSSPAAPSQTPPRERRKKDVVNVEKGPVAEPAAASAAVAVAVPPAGGGTPPPADSGTAMHDGSPVVADVVLADASPVVADPPPAEAPLPSTDEAAAAPVQAAAATGGGAIWLVMLAGVIVIVFGATLLSRSKPETVTAIAPQPAAPANEIASALPGASTTTKSV